MQIIHNVKPIVLKLMKVYENRSWKYKFFQMKYIIKNILCYEQCNLLNITSEVISNFGHISSQQYILWQNIFFKCQANIREENNKHLSKNIISRLTTIFPKGTEFLTFIHSICLLCDAGIRCSASQF